MRRTTSSASSGGTGGGDNAAGGGGTVLAKTSDIPEGGGKVFEAPGRVVDPAGGGHVQGVLVQVHHQGCAVKGIADNVITCPCHKSQFSATDGSVTKVRRPSRWPPRNIAVDGDSITLA